LHDGAAAPQANELALGGNTITAPPSATPGLDGGLADSSFVNGVADGEAGAAAPTGGSTQSLLSSLLKTLTGGTDGTAPSIDLGSGHDQAAVAPALVTTAPSNEHAIATTQVTSLPAVSPTIASASFGAMGNDSFAFHANLGGGSAQNTAGHANELANNGIQVNGPAIGSTAPEFHAEFALDVVHQDDTHLAATVDQFHQMASNSTLLH
jgi:hypothetical protein